MKLSEEEKPIYNQVYATEYSKYGDAYHAIDMAEQAVYDLRYEIRQKNRRY